MNSFPTTQPPPSQLVLPTESLTQPDFSFNMLESALLSEKQNLRRVDSCGSLDSHSHKYATRGEVIYDSKIDEPLRVSRENVTRDEVEEGPYGEFVRNTTAAVPVKTRRNRSLQHDFLSQQPMSTSPQTADYMFRPIPVTNERPKTAKELRTSHPRNIVRPSSTTPESRRRIYGVNPVTVARKYSAAADHEPKIMTPSPSRRVPSTFRHLANEIGQLPNRCDTTVDYTAMMYRSESLV